MTAALALAAPLAEYVETFECPDCQGQGEIGTGQDYFGNWDTAPCHPCDGTGSVTHLPVTDEDEPEEIAA